MTQSISNPIFTAPDYFVRVERDAEFKHIYWLKIDGTKPRDFILDEGVTSIGLSDGTLLSFDTEKPKEINVLTSGEDFIEKVKKHGNDTVKMKPHSIQWVVVGVSD